MKFSTENKTNAYIQIKEGVDKLDAIGLCLEGREGHDLGQVVGP